MVYQLPISEKIVKIPIYLSVFTLPIRYNFMDKANNLGFPLAYHITITCYGTWLHGSNSGSVHRSVNTYGTLRIRPDPHWVKRETAYLKQQPYSLDSPRRKIVLNAIREVCHFRNWDLITLHVRSEHIHIMVSASAEPEKIMNDFKAYASRALSQAGYDSKDRKRWARHGSTEYLWDEKAMENVYNYVVYKQGEAMELYVRE
ncbi:MAG: transposase [bacterium]|nr:transposase [bacterium]